MDQFKKSPPPAQREKKEHRSNKYIAVRVRNQLVAASALQMVDSGHSKFKRVHSSRKLRPKKQLKGLSFIKRIHNISSTSRPNELTRFHVNFDHPLDAFCLGLGTHCRHFLYFVCFAFGFFPSGARRRSSFLPIWRCNVMRTLQRICHRHQQHETGAKVTRNLLIRHKPSTRFPPPRSGPIHPPDNLLPAAQNISPATARRRAAS